MPTTSASYSPIKIISDLGIVEPWDIDSDEDYLSGLMEAVNTLSVSNSSDNRIPILQEEIVRIRRDRKSAAPSAGMKATKKKISAEAFKKGSAVGGAQKVSANAKAGSAIVPYKAPTTDLSTDINQPEQSSVGMQSIVQSIADNVDSIYQTLIDQIQSDNKNSKKDSKKAEQDKRNLRESFLESKAFKNFGKVAQKVLAPVKSMFDRIIGFLTTLIMGRIVMKFLNWWQDPKNKEKVTSILKFIKDWWPALTAAVLLFGTSFGRISSVLLVQMTTVWIPKMLMAIGSLMSNPWIAAAVLAAGGIYAIGKMVGKDKVVENETARANASRTALESAESTKDLSAGDREALVQGTRPRDAGGGGSLNNMPDQFNDPLGLRNDPLGFNEGGSVTGPSGIDKVPARLTAGEFVMSKGAVNRWGSGTFAAMNAFGGGKNTGSPSRGYNEGGKVSRTTTKIPNDLVERLLLFRSIIEQPEVKVISNNINSLFTKMDNLNATVEPAGTKEIPSAPVERSKPVVITPETSVSQAITGGTGAFSDLPIFSAIPSDGGMSQKIKVLGFIR